MKTLNISLKLTMLLVTVVVMTSCNSYKHSYRESNIPNKKVNVADKVGVELEMDESKVIRATTTRRHASVQDAKDEAYYNAITQNNIHVLVDPIYKVTTSGKILIFGGKSTAEVIGFAGMYKNARSYQEILDEEKADEIEKEQARFDAALANMKKLKEDGTLKQSNSESVDPSACGKNCVVTKTSTETSIVDEYKAFVSGVKDPSSVGGGSNASNDDAVVEESEDDEPKKKGLFGFFKRKK